MVNRYVWSVDFNRSFSNHFEIVQLSFTNLYRFAATESNLSVMFYLINQDHDTYGLLDDKKVKKLKELIYEKLQT